MVYSLVQSDTPSGQGLYRRAGPGVVTTCLLHRNATQALRLALVFCLFSLTMKVYDVAYREERDPMFKALYLNVLDIESKLKSLRNALINYIGSSQTTRNTLFGKLSFSFPAFALPALQRCKKVFIWMQQLQRN